MAERLNIVLEENLHIHPDMIQMIAEDFIEWQNEQSST